MIHNKENETDHICNYCALNDIIDSFDEAIDQFDKFLLNNYIEQELFPVLDEMKEAIMKISLARRKVLQAEGYYLFQTPQGYEIIPPDELSDFHDNAQLN